jgi:outer membrane immunogenic protein
VAKKLDGQGEETEALVMKRALTLGIGVLALVGSTFTAGAADLGARPISRAPIMAPVFYNWSGFYVGVGLGARWDENEWTTTCLAPTFLGTATCPNDVFGPRITVANPTTFEPDVGFRVSGYVGYNWQFQNWVLGVEGDFAWADNDATVDGIPGTFTAALGPGLDTASVNDKLDASFRGRIGYLFAPQALFYVTGGVAWLEKEVTATCAGTFPFGWCNDPLGVAQSDSNHHLGWTVGGGVEWMFTQNWILRAEYRYSQYQEETYTFFANAGIPAGIDSFSFEVDAQTHTAYAGIAYKF